jgi:hypothetical protein
VSSEAEAQELDSGRDVESRSSSEAEAREMDLGMDAESRASSEAEAWEQDLGTDLNSTSPYGRTHEAISEIWEITGWYVR